MQPRRDKIPGLCHLTGHLSVAWFIRSNESQTAKLMEELQIGNKQEKHYGERLEFRNERRRRRD